MSSKNSKKGYHAVNISGSTPSVVASNICRHVDQDKQQLLDAVKLNDLNKCRHLLDNEICLKEKDSNFLSHSFLRAAKNGHHDILELLLEKGADINVQFNNNYSALHLAIKYHHEQCALILLQKGIKFKELHDQGGNLALHLAALENMEAVVEWMINKGQDTNVKNKKIQTPLHFAAMGGHAKLINILLCNDITDKNSKLPLHYAAEKGHKLCCDELLKRNPEHSVVADNEGNTPLILAAKNGYSNCCNSLCSALVSLKRLPKDGWDKVDDLGNTAAHYATKKGFINTIQELQRVAANFSIKDRETESTPVHIAALQKNIKCFKNLIIGITTCPGVNANKQSILHLVALNSWEEPLNDLLQKDISFKNAINLQDTKKQTALHLAILNSSEVCIDVLLQNGADFSLPDDEGNTPLHLAASKGLMKTCEWILQGDGIQLINLKNEEGDTPLYMAASNGSLSCCNLLLNKGASIKIKNKNGFSTYHESAAKGKLEILKLLTKYRRSLIDIKILDIAAKNGHYECCEYILGNIDRNSLSSLYVAFESKKDEIFSLILPRCIRYNEKVKIDEFKLKLHGFMHEALFKGNKRPIIQKAIIKSRWWFAGFSSCFCKEGQCGNLLNLTIYNSEYARLVLDRCVVIYEGVDVYDFRLLEQDYYIKITDASKSTKTIVAPPYDLETGEFLQESLRHNKGCQESPLNEALDNGRRKVIQHPLIDGYWEYKWKKYLMLILIGLLAIHVLIIAALGLYMLHSWNWTQVNATLLSLNNKLQQNGSDPIPYSILENCSLDIPRVLEMPEINFQFLNFLRFCLAVVTIFSFVAEYQMFMKFDFKSFMTFGAILRNFRIVLILLVILPMTSRNDQRWILMTWQWLSGIVALLMSWFHMIYTINKFPALSVFLPITYKFTKSFFLVLLYILLIVFIFAFIFYLLFSNHLAFTNIGVAFVKTIIWVMGDLAYDDMFLNEDKPILYFAFSNVIFIVFVTSISGFIVNLIITQPTEKYQSFEIDAAWHRDSNRIKMLLKFDKFYQRFRKRNTIIFWAKGREADVDMMRRLMKAYQEDVALPPKIY